jgi:hypothetical protein
MLCTLVLPGVALCTVIWHQLLISLHIAWNECGSWIHENLYLAKLKLSNLPPLALNPSGTAWISLSDKLTFSRVLRHKIDNWHWKSYLREAESDWFNWMSTVFKCWYCHWQWKRMCFPNRKTHGTVGPPGTHSTARNNRENRTERYLQLL